MIIKSSFKDYYDFVAKQFGGGDPRVVYARGRLAPIKNIDGAMVEGTLEVEIDNCPLEDLSRRRYFTRWSEEYDEKNYAYLVICGKCYLIWSDLSIDKNNLNSYSLVPVDLIEETLKKKSRYYWRPYDFGIVFGKESPFLIELSRKIKEPVFVIQEVNYFGYGRTQRSAKIIIAGQCPILNEIGIPAIIQPYQMYQDIAYFVGNTLKPVPDNAPPVEVTNRMKILKAGFDLVTAFRHRK